MQINDAKPALNCDVGVFPTSTADYKTNNGSEYKEWSALGVRKMDEGTLGAVVEGIWIFYFGLTDVSPLTWSSEELKKPFRWRVKCPQNQK